MTLAIWVVIAGVALLFFAERSERKKKGDP